MKKPDSLLLKTLPFLYFGENTKHKNDVMISSVEGDQLITQTLWTVCSRQFHRKFFISKVRCSEADEICPLMHFTIENSLAATRNMKGSVRKLRKNSASALRDQRRLSCAVVISRLDFALSAARSPLGRPGEVTSALVSLTPGRSVQGERAFYKARSRLYRS